MTVGQNHQLNLAKKPIQDVLKQQIEAHNKMSDAEKATKLGRVTAWEVSHLVSAFGNLLSAQHPQKNV